MRLEAQRVGLIYWLGHTEVKTEWVSIEGARANAAGAVAINAKVSATTNSQVISVAAVSRSAAATAAAVAAAVDAVAMAAVAAVLVTVAASAAAVAAATAAAAAAGFRGGGGGGGFRGGGAGGGGMPPQVVGEGKGVVKFFNPQKGFGFVVRDDGGEDVFVHISAVEQAGLTDLADGQPLEFTLVDRGGRISATNLQIEGEPMAVERAERGPQRQLTGEKATGVVKFFNSMKGFGFIQRDDGQPDAFVHISAVERAGESRPSTRATELEFELEVDRRGKTAAVNLQAIS